jgi:hypothetical protein
MPTINCLTYDPGSDDNSQQNYKNVASCGAFPSCPDRRRFVKFTDVPGRRAFLSPSVKTGMIEVIKMDLHGYHPSEIVQTDVLKKIIQQTWEMGENYLTLIHGHGRNRGISPGFFNTNTGYFGLEIRRALRHDKELRQWIRYTTLDCSHMGVTRVKLKPNPAPTRSELDHDLLPEMKAGRRSW